MVTTYLPRLLAQHVHVAGTIFSSWESKQVFPHVLRHCAAMEPPQAGVVCSVIPLWLSREANAVFVASLHIISIWIGL